MNNIVAFLTLFLLAGCSVFAQVGINSDSRTPDASAMLDVKSNGSMPLTAGLISNSTFFGPFSAFLLL